MKNTGITRRVDSVGRIVVPQEIKSILNWSDREKIEISQNLDDIVLAKAEIFSTGLIRGVDKLGRLVIPKEIRHNLGLKESESVIQFFIEDNKVIVKKFQLACIFCNEDNDLVDFEGKKICRECLNKIKNI